VTSWDVRMLAEPNSECKAAVPTSLKLRRTRGGGRRIDDFGFRNKKFLNGGDDTAGVVRGF
jgi:hypothetical protein